MKEQNNYLWLLGHTLAMTICLIGLSSNIENGELFWAIFNVTFLILNSHYAICHVLEIIDSFKTQESTNNDG